MTTEPHGKPLLGLLLRLAAQSFGDRVDEALRAAGFDGIRPAHANVFPFVPPQGIQVAELARLARVRKQTMADTVAQLESMGYAERRPDPNDRRARLVFLTERGEAVRPVGTAAGRQVEAAWAERVGDRELEELRATLLRVLDGS